MDDRVRAGGLELGGTDAEVEGERESAARCDGARDACPGWRSEGRR